jgi:hypothetical protein
MKHPAADFLLQSNKKRHAPLCGAARIASMAPEGPYAVKNSVKRYFL